VRERCHHLKHRSARDVHTATVALQAALERLPFPSIVVASRDDRYVTPEQARRYASAWGSELVDVGDAGHVNGASGLATWPIGYGLLQRLRVAS
jgi:predicted alpha/beta hydrolase family esterase